MGVQSTQAFAGSVRVMCGDIREAQLLLQALRADDDAWVTTAVSGSTLVAEFTADSPQGLRRAMDDFCSSLYVAESALGVMPKPERT